MAAGASFGSGDRSPDAVRAAAVLASGLERANKVFDEGHLGYSVEDVSVKFGPKDPVFLRLSYEDGSKRDIGIVHLVRLEGDCWDDRPYSSVAKSVDEVADAMIRRVRMFLAEEMSESSDTYISERGTIFHCGAYAINVHADNTFHLSWKEETGSRETPTVTFKDSAIKITQLMIEGIIKLSTTHDGDIQFRDDFDQRTGKGIFLKPDIGAIYRG